MKAVGIIRRVDTLGRVVIPSELRKALYINEGDPIEILADAGGIYLRKYSTEGPVKEALDAFATEVKNEPDLPNRAKIQKKIKELNALLQEG